MDATFDFESMKRMFYDSNFYYLICTDNVGNYSYINKRYASSFGFIADDFVNRPYHITMHPDDTKVCEEVGAKCYANPGKLFPATLRKHNGSGGYIVTQWEFILMVENNEPQGIFCLGYDITEFLSAKNEAYIATRNLENKNGILDSIAYEQSHIVRAPVANILGLVNILKGLDLGVNASTVVKMLEQSTIQLDQVIRNIVSKTYNS